ncbi:MAG: sialate O-acetylesterase [Bacteroidetes bacterium]|nr:sialate O-acetylesterase [Bacteroidota bacterium]
MKTIILTILISILVACSAFGTIKLPAILSDNMVLQQQSNVNLWGWAEPNSKITVKPSWSKKNNSTVADANGKWELAVKTPVAGGPYDITISDGKPVKLSNVLIGEVWICSGQSNMYQPMKGYHNGWFTDETTDAINLAKPSTPIRIANVELTYNREIQQDCKVKWVVNCPETVANAPSVAYFFAQYINKALDVPVGIIHTSWGGSSISAWMSKELLQNQFPEVDLKILETNGDMDYPQNKPTVVYNAMLSPLRNFTAKGFLWYQGEANIRTPEQYEKMQIAMMNSWRRDFSNLEMPFYYVQLAPFKNDKIPEFSYGYFYEAQANILAKTKYSGMVVTVDVGNEKIVHPPKKKIVGERLAYWALAQTYGFKIQYRSPSFKTMSITGNKVQLEFNEADLGLHSSESSATGFELAGEDHQFYPAEAIFSGKLIELNSAKVDRPVAVRYCFRNGQIGHIYNNYGLPLIPFRTDSWEKLR